MRILLAEDELQISDFISRGLTENGYSVDVAHDGEEAVQWPSVAEFDVIILDVLLPVLDGIEVCHTLRKRGLRTPILMLTARDAVEDRVLGLDSGADDYLVKPFAFSELLARLRALSRREPALLGNPLQVSDLVLDTATRQVVRSDTNLDLTAKEFSILEYFMRHPGQVLSRNVIAEHVWNYDFENATNVIDVHTHQDFALAKEVSDRRQYRLAAPPGRCPARRRGAPSEFAPTLAWTTVWALCLHRRNRANVGQLMRDDPKPRTSVPGAVL